MDLQDFHGTYKNIICCPFKTTGFWPSADAKPLAMI
jgi:hypothetical protein